MLVLLRNRLGVFNTTYLLLAYGVLILLGEHAGFTITYALGGLPQEGYSAPPHARVHAFMATVYAILGLTGFVTLAAIMLRGRSRTAWWILLAATVLGGSVDLVVNGPIGLIFRHTSPPNPILGANVLWVYVVAFGAALTISRRAVFHPKSTTPIA